MKIFNKILHSYAIYCRKEMVKIFKCYLIPKKSYDTLSKGAIFLGQPCTIIREILLQDMKAALSQNKNILSYLI